jgi:hypothetical protein
MTTIGTIGIRRVALGLAAASCAFAAASAPALAHQFTANATPATTRGPGEGLQQLTLKPFTIKCAAATSTGKITASPSPTLLDEVKYTKCKTDTLPAKFVTPIDYEYNAEGFVSIVNPATVEIKVSGIECVVTIPDQRIPGEEEGKSAIYTTELIPTTQLKKFPSGFRDRLVLHNRFKEISYDLSGGLCEELEEKEHSEGTGSGVLRDEIASGSLGWE